jgi:hypothetical protein
MLGAVSGDVGGAAGAAGAASVGGGGGAGGGGAGVCAAAEAIKPHCHIAEAVALATRSRDDFEVLRFMMWFPTDRQASWHDVTDGDGSRHLLEVYNVKDDRQLE